MLDGKVEIITGRERRRRWSDADKLRIVAEADAAGACFSHVAHRNEVSRGLLWNWRTQVRRGELRPEAPSVFVPVQVVEAPPILASVAPTVPVPALSIPSRRRACRSGAALPTRSRWSFRTAASCGWAGR